MICRVKRPFIVTRCEQRDLIRDGEGASPLCSGGWMGEGEANFTLRSRTNCSTEVQSFPLSGVKS